MVPQARTHLGTRPTATKEVTVDEHQSSEPAHPSTARRKLAKFEERLAHKLMDDAERQELRDRVLLLRRRRLSSMARR
jgi:hypothetical protein